MWYADPRRKVALLDDAFLSPPQVTQPLLSCPKGGRMEVHYLDWLHVYATSYAARVQTVALSRGHAPHSLSLRGSFRVSRSWRQ